MPQGVTMFRKGMTQEQKDALWADKMNAARRFASHYNTRMMVRANRWEHVSAHAGQPTATVVEWEYVITKNGMPRRCY